MSLSRPVTAQTLCAKVDKLNIDLLDAARQKMTENADKYPVERARGSNRKCSRQPHSDNGDPTMRMTSKSRMRELVLMAATAGLTQGCATLIKGSSQSIPVSSDPPAADILLDGKLVGQTPKTLVLKRNNNYLITIQKAAFEQQSVSVVKDIGGAVWGNVLAGGLVGWGVDAASGAQYNLLPPSVSVKLVPVNTVVKGMAADDSKTFVSKLKALDQQHDAKQISDQDYVNGRLDLFKKYMPEALPADSASQPK